MQDCILLNFFPSTTLTTLVRPIYAGHEELDAMVTPACWGLVSICIGYGNSNSPGLVSLPGARAPECLTQACRSAHSTIILQSFCNHSAIIV